MQRVKLPSRIWTGMRDSPTGRALPAEEEWLIRTTHESGSYNPPFPCESETVSTTKAILTNCASSYHLISALMDGEKHPFRNLTQTCISKEFQLRPTQCGVETVTLLSLPIAFKKKSGHNLTVYTDVIDVFLMLPVFKVPARLQMLPPPGC